MIIEHIIQFQNFIDQYCFIFTQLANNVDENILLNKLSLVNQKIFIKIQFIFKPFFIGTKYLKRNAIDKSHSVFQKIVSDIKYFN